MNATGEFLRHKLADTDLTDQMKKVKIFRNLAEQRTSLDMKLSGDHSFLP